MVMNFHMPSMPMGLLMMGMNVILFIIGFLLIGGNFGITTALYAIVCVALNGIIIDKVIEGFTSVKAVMVFSNDSQLIKSYIINELNRGCTVFEGEGGFTGSKSSVIYAVMDRAQLINLRTYIKKEFPDAFIIVSEAHEVLGQGFENM